MTLIAGPGEAALADVVATLPPTLPVIAAPDWLAPGIACDLAVAQPDRKEAERWAHSAIGRAAIDVLVQPAAGRRKRILVADLEATIIENEMLDELAEFADLRAHVAEITRRAMNGELDFAAALAERVALLKGLPAAVLDEAAARIRLTPGARQLLATSRAAGVTTALVSGGFTVFADRVAAELGFDHVLANRLDIADGRIAGTVAAPIVTRESKRDALLALARDAGVAPSAVLAVGDGANDLPMLLAAGLGVAFHAKPTVAAAARWRLGHADLAGLLYAQGYRHSEIIA
ncbi:MAG TPA: phosphoserine phosphatase SerB [Stellaceae bacterium]|nr:phosphoserine phosphatase SerB [Stellaceae bacterium]